MHIYKSVQVGAIKLVYCCLLPHLSFPPSKAHPITSPIWGGSQHPLQRTKRKENRMKAGLEDEPSCDEKNTELGSIAVEQQAGSGLAGLFPYLDNDHLTLTHIVSSPHGSLLSHQSNRISFSTFPSETFHRGRNVEMQRQVSTLRSFQGNLTPSWGLGCVGGPECRLNKWGCARSPQNYLTQII